MKKNKTQQYLLVSVDLATRLGRKGTQL